MSCAQRRRVVTWNSSTLVCRRNSIPNRSSKFQPRRRTSRLRRSPSTSRSDSTRICGPSGCSDISCEFGSTLEMTKKKEKRRAIEKERGLYELSKYLKVKNNHNRQLVKNKETSTNNQLAQQQSQICSSTSNQPTQLQSYIHPSTNKPTQLQSYIHPSTNKPTQLQSYIHPSTNKLTQLQSYIHPSTNKPIQLHSLTKSWTQIYKLFSKSVFRVSSNQNK